jgi:hypothetical protein
VTSRLAPKLILALALLATVPLKAVELDARPADPWHDHETAAVQMLRSAGYEAEAEWRISARVIKAQSARCELLIRQAYNSNLDAIAVRMPSGWRLSFVYGGEVLPEFPALRVRLDGWRTRTLQKLGFGAVWQPVLGVTASSGCDVGALPWRTARLR